MSVVQFHSEDQQHRFIDGDMENFAGGMAHKNSGRNNNYTLFNLDSFDIEYTKDVKLKENEILFRFQTDKSKLFGIKPLVKINVKNAMAYFLIDMDNDEKIIFERKGNKMWYCNLINL